MKRLSARQLEAVWLVVISVFAGVGCAVPFVVQILIIRWLVKQ